MNAIADRPNPCRARCPTPGLGAVLMAAACLLTAPRGAVAAIDVAAPRDFANPGSSEQRFREALATAQGDDALILQTQIACTHGLRRDMPRARELLQALEPQLAGAGPEARARHALEWGRNHISAVTRPAERTPENLDTARSAYLRALAVAREGALDGLAIDAVHMMAFVDDAPADQLRWNQQALAMVPASTQPAGRHWQASIRNNLANRLHLLGRHAESLPHRERALAQQTRLERQMHVVGDPDPCVLEEIELIHRARGDEARAAAHAERLAAARRKP
ncbi:MAG: hypothetical protein RL227_1418 [Pseudomonadota bacterium]